MYSFYKHAYLHIGLKEGENPGEFDGSPIEQFADTLVNDLMELDKENISHEAILVNNVWMAVVYYLNTASRTCKYPAENGPLAYLDLAAGLYIGIGQDEGDNESGDM
eukprot:1330159-Ditylum_brightwellii.AAC.1